LGVDWDTYLTVGWENRFAGLAQHRETHTWRDDFEGEDPFSIYRRQIFDLRCEPIGSGTSSVLVTPYGLNDGGIFKTWPGSPGIDLSGAIPSATGTVRNVLVYWNFTGTTAYGSLGIASGTTTTVSDAIVPPKPAGPTSSIPSGFVKLQGGQTQITEQDITDARPLFTPVGGDDLARVSKVYKSTFEDVALLADADGGIGIGTDTIPHAGVGVALLALEGADFSEANGPHIQITTDFTDYPLVQHFHLGHDEMSINFDAFVDSDGDDISSAVWNNFQIQKSNGNFRIRYDTAIAAGGAISWLEGITLNGTSGNVGIGASTPVGKLESVSSTLAQLRLTHTFSSKFADFTVDTNHDLTIKPSSTGQIKLQPTTDSVDFFQVLDADGGTPVLNVDVLNERVGISNAAPSSRLHITANGDTILTIDGSHIGTLCNIAPTNTGSGGSAQVWRQVPIFAPSAALGSAINFNTNVNVSNSGFNITNVIPVNSLATINNTYAGDITTAYNYLAQGITDNGSGTVTNYRAYAANDEGAATNNFAFWSSFSNGAGKFALYMSGDADNYLAGNLGIGTTSPQGPIHSYESISGFLIWEFDGLNATVREIIPNGTGDVLYRLHAAYVLRDSAAAVASGTTDVSNGASVNLTVGANTVRLRVNADGSCDVARTAGANTIKVALTLRWL
jgi:hypothetical protein